VEKPLGFKRLNTTYHIPDRKQTTRLRYAFKLAISNPSPLKYSYCSQLAHCYISLLPNRFNSQNLKYFVHERPTNALILFKVYSFGYFLLHVSASSMPSSGRLHVPTEFFFCWWGRREPSLSHFNLRGSLYSNPFLVPPFISRGAPRHMA
jgi:hypothetical protein